MSILTNRLKALGALVLLYAAPLPKAEAAINLSVIDSILVFDEIQGAAQTKNAKLALSDTTVHLFENDLSGESQRVLGQGYFDDAGSWDDEYFLVLGAATTVDKVRISDGAVVDWSSVNGTPVSAISSIFRYNDGLYFAAIEGDGLFGRSQTIQYFRWGETTPVVTGPEIGTGATGLEVLVNGSVDSLDAVSLLVSRPGEGTDAGSMFEQYYGDALIETYRTNTSGSITDLAYNWESGILTAVHAYDGVGDVVNIDFGDYVYRPPSVPEPAWLATGLGIVGLGSALRRRRRQTCRKF